MMNAPGCGGCLSERFFIVSFSNEQTIKTLFLYLFHTIYVIQSAGENTPAYKTGIIEPGDKKGS